MLSIARPRTSKTYFSSSLTVSLRTNESGVIVFSHGFSSLDALCISLILNHAWVFRTAHSTYAQYESSREFVGSEQIGPLLVKYTRGLAEVVEVKELWQNTETVPLFRVQFIHESVREYVFLPPTRHHCGHGGGMGECRVCGPLHGPIMIQLHQSSMCGIPRRPQ